MKTRNLIMMFALVLTLGACEKKPKNIIFLIGDGMGLPQMTAGMQQNGNYLHFERCTHFGFSKTYSYSNIVTDSGAGGTALACGIKTRNAMIGMNPDSTAAESIIEVAERNGLATGILASCELTDATPASFIAHQPNRHMHEELAADFLNTDIDIIIGGDWKVFTNRADGRNLIEELAQKDYQIAYTIDECKQIKRGKLAAVLDNPQQEITPQMPMPQRGNMMPEAITVALDILSNNSKKGFFLMLEGSQIDWGAHQNNYEYVVNEVLDFNNVIGRALDFAEKDGNTLVIITADHETGGLTLPKLDENNFAPRFTTTSHTGCLVPIYAYGPGAKQFSCIMENSSFKEKMMKLLNIQ